VLDTAALEVVRFGCPKTEDFGQAEQGGVEEGYLDSSEGHSRMAVCGAVLSCALDTPKDDAIWR